MDGTSRTVLHDTTLSTPYALTIDYATQTLFWADYSLNRLEKSNIDGSNRVLLTTNVRDPYSITFLDGNLYWTDLYYNRILTAPVSSPSSSSYVTSSLGNIYGIQAISEERQALCKLLQCFFLQESY